MARKEKGLVSRIVSFIVSWIIGILISILISIWKFFRKKRGRGGNEEWCESTYKYSYKSTYKYSYKSTYKYSYKLTYKYSYKSTYKYMRFFPKGKGLVEGGTRKGLWFSSVFRGLSPRSLTRKPTYNKTCNPTYNPSYCPHTSVVARGGTAVGVFGTAELWLRKHGGEGKSLRWS